MSKKPEIITERKSYPATTNNPSEIVVEKRPHDWKAYIKGEPGYWGNGPTWSAAIGQLVDVYPEKFNIKITYPRNLNHER